MVTLDFVRSFVSKEKVQASRQVGTLGRVSVYLPLATGLFCYVWWRCLPVYPGYALSAFALAGIILIARADVSRPEEKLLWVLICAVLLFAECRVARRGRVDAQSYLLCTFTNGAALVTLQGTVNVRSASMHVVNQVDLNAFKASQSVDGEQYNRLFQAVPLGDFSVGQRKLFCLKPLQTSGDIAHYRVWFDALNGSWWEDIQVRVVRGEQVQALRVLRYQGSTPKMLFEHEDPGFPRSAEHGVDWSWATPAF